MHWVQTSSDDGMRIDRGRKPTQQLAIDEAMLLTADNSDIGEPTERIRLWQFDQPVVVLGRSSRIDDEVDRDFVQRCGIPIERRSSGGASVVGGPGCLMYSVVLRLDDKPGLQKIDQAHRYVMERLLEAIQQQIPDAEHQGICDLTWNNKKFSGNSLRLARRHLLYHGTLLYDFDLPLLASCLDFAPRQPNYRDERDHDSFVTNVSLNPERFAADLGQNFAAVGSVSNDSYAELAGQLQRDRYNTDAWRFRH